MLDKDLAYGSACSIVWSCPPILKNGEFIVASRFGFVLAFSLPLSFFCQSHAQDKVGITVGATKFTAAEVALAKRILTDHAERVKQLPELEKEVDSLRKAKIVPVWNSTYEKLGEENRQTAYTPVGRNKKKPDEYVIVGKNTKTAKQDKEKAIEAAEKKLQPVKSLIKDFDEGKLPMPDLIVGDLKVGKVGNLNYGSGVVGGTPYRIRTEVFQIISEKEMFVKMFGKIVSLEGKSTVGMVDDEVFYLSGTYHVTGTKKYETAAGGSNTVFVIRPFENDKFIELVKHLQDAK